MRFRQLDRLGCEWIIDNYCRELGRRLLYIQHGKFVERQREFAFEMETEQDASGDQRLRLPVCFLGSPVWTTARTAEALTLARKLGNPHSLITATFNPRWPEVVQHLTPRIFKLRMQQLLAALRKHFGPLAYSVWVVEFQKRDLPHAHVIIRTSTALPFEAIDQVISAELCRGTDAISQRLRSLQLLHMQHSRGYLNQTGHSHCRSPGGYCKYGFPYEVRERVSTILLQRRAHV